MTGGFEYRVVEVRGTGGKVSGAALEKVLNEHARDGWQLKALTATEIRGLVGTGRVEGLLATFERPLG